ncbi:AMP-binding protein [Mesorhizobium sp. YIM 152430]|uniref:AMP-binding protein n=1 Tax=Mesorhizobium sp. YIM 152430 TaxID=3031761 RepID=UPI0023DBA9CF|nr:AMP-binding protein [Mesorhizobium sp. YIM 152430]MDF1600475.1 AMP-binding protein [Mesorhizobium sp. YIM 152430]
MLQTVLIIAGVLALWAAFALWLSHRQGISIHQALLYAPLKLVFRIDDSSLRAAQTPGPVIYAISHQSRLDPALMLSVLPNDTLHILDEASSRAMWLEPWRELARTIAFKAQHVFVNRRLTRRLKGNGRLAVYFPFDAEPDVKSFRLYRAVAKIAVSADAKVVPIYIRGSSHLPGAYEPAAKTPRQLLPKLRIMALPARTIGELVEDAGPVGITTSNALFDRVAEARFFSQGRPKTIFHAVRSAALLYGPGRVIAEDVAGEKLVYRALFAKARILSGKLVEIGTSGDIVGLLLPNAAQSIATFLALQSAGRVVAMMGAGVGPVDLVRDGTIRIVVTSRAHVEKARLAGDIEAIAAAGGRIVYVEDLESSVTMSERVLGWIAWRARRLPRQADDAAVVLFKQTANGQRGVVLSHANLIANAAQIEARLVLSRSDTILSVLPLHTALGLTVGLILPLMKGVRALAYPSPLHTRQIPQVAGTRHPTILFATDALLAAYAKAAQTNDFDSLRLIVSGGERLRAATRQLWADRFGKTIMEGYGLTEASPVVAVNSITHGRAGTVGRLLPGMRMRIEPIDGFELGGRLKIAGPNIAIRYLSADEAMATDGWFDTGDIVSVDREGYLTTLGRAGRLAVIGGTTVSLALVEEAAEAIWPNSIHAAVALRGTTGDDQIVLVTTHPDADRAVLARQWKRHGFDDAVLPSKLIPIRSMPTTTNGRIDHARLVAICEEELGLSSAA